MPRDRKQQGEDQHDKWLDVISKAKQGLCAEIYPREFVVYHTTLVRMYEPRLQTLDSYSGLWFQGPPGTGKSKKAREDYPQLYNKLINKWWDNYDGEATVLLDDVGPNHGFLGDFLKNWTDHYPFRAEFKGGSRMIRPERIVVTSNYAIEEIWPETMMFQALSRRFTVVKFE